MKTNLIIPVLVVIVFPLCMILDSSFIESWHSFLCGAIFALAVRDIGNAFSDNTTRRSRR